MQPNKPKGEAIVPLTSQISNDWFTAELSPCPLIVILRALGPESTVQLARLAWNAGVSLVEVPVQTAEDIEALRAVVLEAASVGRSVGAGTVTNPDRLRLAVNAGARFTIAPGVDEEVISLSLKYGLPHLPGVATASDIGVVRRVGLRWAKAFPANALTPDWFSAMRGPFPEVNFVATGGITPANAAVFLQQGAVAVGVGSSAATPDGITQMLDIIGSRNDT